MKEFDLSYFSEDDQKNCLRNRKDVMQYTVEDLNFLYENFKKRNADYKYADSMKLSDDVEENFDAFFDMLLRGKIQDMQSLPYAIFKSYIERNEEEALKFVNVSESKIKKPQKIFADFIGRYLIKEEEAEEFKALKTKGELDNFLGKIIVSRIKERLPRYAYLDLSNLTPKKSVRVSLIGWFRQNGYEHLEQDANISDIFVSKEESIVKPEYQEYLIKSYCQFVDRYVANFYKKYSASIASLRSVEKGVVEREWQLLEAVVSAYEESMTEESKSKIKDYIEKAKYIYNEQVLSKVISTSTREGKLEGKYQSILDACRKANNGRLQEEDKRILKDFFNKLLETKKALTEQSVDKYGRQYTHKTNFFKIFKIAPRNIYDCVLEFSKAVDRRKKVIQAKEKKVPLTKAESDSLETLTYLANEIESVRYLLSANFSWSWMGGNSYVENYERLDGISERNILTFIARKEACSIKNIQTGRTLNEQDIYKCATDTVKYIKENDLPELPVCAKTVFDALVNDYVPLSKSYIKPSASL